MTKLSEYCRAQRFAQHLSWGDLSRRLGAKNVSKMANKLDRFEREGMIDRGLLDALVTALGLDPGLVEDLRRADQEEFERAWNKWADEPIRPHLIARLIPGAYMHIELPDAMLSPTQAEEFAVQYAKEHRRKVCLVLSRRLSVWIAENGSVEDRTEARPGQPNAPYMTLDK